MKKLKLNLDQLSEELEILDFEYLRGVKGGYGDTGGGYGDYGYYTGYGGTPDDPIELDEVEVNGGYGGYGGGDSGGGWPGWFPPAWPGTGGDTGGDTGGYAPIGGGYGGYGYMDAAAILNHPGQWSFVNGEFVWTSNNGTFSVDANYSANDAIGVMLSSMGMASDHADVASAVLKLESKGFSIASKSFGVLGIIQNAVEMSQDGEWNWTDGGQIALGAALMIPGLNGALVIAGGAVLFGWELYEMLNE